MKMYYDDKDNKIDWEGKTSVVPNPNPGNACVVITAENDKGTPVININAGKLVPDNWIGKRVRITVELLP